MSPTQRTLAYLRKRGFECGVTEKYNRFAKVRQDLFGFIDIVCIPIQAQGIIAVQTTSNVNHTTRVKKIQAEPRAKKLIERGNTVVVISWRKVLGRWKPRVERITLEHFK